MVAKYFLTLAILVLVNLALIKCGGRNNRKGKFLFEIVRFPNDPCTGSGNQNGTCYTAEECTTRNGINQGSCAQGYGVCCVFVVNSCGERSQENCTYFQTPTEVPTNAECTLTVCPSTDNICQLRLDFNSFVITGPTTITTSVGNAVNNEIANVGAAGRDVALAGQCLTDTFTVTSPGGNAPPVICGTNSQQHIYVDASRGDCNDLVFQLGNDAVGATEVTRQWNIKVTQYSCSFDNLAPSGCDQFFFGSNSASVQTFNFDGGRHLADQNQVVCVRRERGLCRICWTTLQPTDFQFSAGMANPNANIGGSIVNDPAKCCTYGAAGVTDIGYDCASILGLEKNSVNNLPFNQQFCGKSCPGTSLCTRLEPFQLRFNTDSFENANEADPATSRGVKMTYILSNTNCD